MSVLRQQLTVLETQVDLLKSMVVAMRTLLDQPRATIVLPETCRPYLAEDCGRQSEDAVLESGGMGGSTPSYMCRGCGLDPRSSV